MKGLLLVLLILLLCSLGVQAETNLWQTLNTPGHVALLRHALAPGTGDPANFSLRDCNTQRNLSEAGREQARSIGDKLRQNGIIELDVYSSQWCRCLETAKLLGFGEVIEQPFINSFFQNYQNREPQINATLNWLIQKDLKKPAILVTHQVNITALTGIFPRSGELLIARIDNDGLTVVGRVETEY